MGHFIYLLNSNRESNDAARVQGEQHTSLEGPRAIYPLPWICCFRTGDLAPYTLTFESGSTYELQVPVTSIENAVRNLEASLPRYERLVGDAHVHVAREYWSQAVEAIKGLPFRYITLRITDFIYLDLENSKSFVRGFGTELDPLFGSDDLFEYFANVPPRPLSEFTTSATARYDKRSIHNSCVLYCPKYAPRVVDYESKNFTRSKELAERGVAGGMFHLGLCYFHGRGTPQDVQEGIRWCINAAEAGWEQAEVFLCAAYRRGPAMDKEKAQYWQERVDRRIPGRHA